MRINDKLMSYSQARKVAQMATYANAVQAAQQATFYKDLAFFQAVAAQEQTIPAAWMPTAICEEGGRNDPYAGYFGILEWNHFDGYPTAGSAPGVGAAGLGGARRRRPARRTRALPQLLSGTRAVRRMSRR